MDIQLLGPSRIRELARMLDLHPTKSLGQNFLHDANTVRRIVATADVRPDDVVLEIGPGLGSLTLGLLETGARVVAVEIDAALAERLPVTLTELAPRAAERVRVVHADAVRLTRLEDPQPTAMVANLPYNVAVPVVLNLLGRLPTLQRSLVMVQSEVAARLAAPPGSKVYGAPSVKAAWYADVRVAMTVSRSIFWPAPNVDSALVSLTAHEPPTRAIGSKDVFAVVDAAFAQRRKMLRSALAGWAGSAAAAAGIVEEAGVDPTARGETLTLAQYVRIAVAGRARADLSAPAARDDLWVPAAPSTESTPDR